MNAIDVAVNFEALELSADEEARISTLLVRAARAALEAHAGGREGELSITLLPDAGMTELNRQFLERDRPTDVIAFSLGEADEPLMGDVYIGFQQAARQAVEVGVELDDELMRLTVHGTLHTLGFDHPEEGREASEMWRAQESIIEQLRGG